MARVRPWFGLRWRAGISTHFVPHFLCIELMKLYHGFFFVVVFKSNLGFSSGAGIFLPAARSN